MQGLLFGLLVAQINQRFLAVLQVDHHLALYGVVPQKLALGVEENHLLEI